MSAEAEARRRGRRGRLRPDQPREALRAATGTSHGAVRYLDVGPALAAPGETGARRGSAMRPDWPILPEGGDVLEGVTGSPRGLDPCREHVSTIVARRAKGGLVVGVRLAPESDDCAQCARDLDDLTARSDALLARRTGLRAALDPCGTR